MKANELQIGDYINYRSLIEKGLALGAQEGMYK